MRMLLILMVLLPGMFQGKGDMETAKPIPPVVVQNVEFVQAKPFTVRITGVHTNGCDLPLVVEQTVQENVVFIDLTQDETEEGTCVDEEIPFEIEVELDLEEVEMIESHDFHRVVIVNDFAVGLYYGEDMDETEEPAVVPVLASPVIIEDVDITSTEDGVEVRARGQLPDGCKGQIVMRQQFDESTAQLQITILRLLPLGVMCPMMVVVFDETFELETDLNGLYTVMVNDSTAIYDFDTQRQLDAEDVTRFHTVIETVDVLVLESFPPQLVLELEGYQPDGCQFPVRTEVRRDGNTIYVEVYRNVPDNVRCPRMITPYKASIQLGSFEPGQYTIDINNGMKTLEIDL